MTTHIALLRSVNVGGNNKIAMADLRAMFAALGYPDARTYIQSGNVVFTGGEDPRMAERLSAAIKDTFGLDVTVVVRTADELRAAMAACPFPEEERGQVQVYFLADAPTAEAIAGLDPQRSPPDRFEVIGREIHALFPNGIGVSKLTNDWFERRLGTRATARNWRTVGTLAALARGPA